MPRGDWKLLAGGTAVVLGLLACSVGEPTVRSGATARAIGPIAERIVEPARAPRGAGDAEPPGARVPRAKSRSTEVDPGAPRETLDTRTACSAWSLDRKGPLDARDVEDLGACRFSTTGEESVARLCGRGDVRKPFELARLDESVLAFDDETRAHVIELAARGRAASRNLRSFGLVGDSITVGSYFLGPFGEGSPKAFSMAPEIALALRTRVDGRDEATIVEWFRGAKLVRELGTWRDAFRATRAAKVGARSVWAIAGERPDGGTDSPLGSMVDRLSPATAVVMYGSNDAAWRIAPPEDLARAFEEDLGRVVDALERRGVVPILSTIPRHGRQPGLRACDRFADDVSNWRLVVQTNAVNASIAKVACERHLPLVDLRHAMDGLVNHGLTKDGIHPTAYLGGAGELTPDGLQCGYNVRNYVTLLMLARVKGLVDPG